MALKVRGTGWGRPPGSRLPRGSGRAHGAAADRIGGRAAERLRGGRERLRVLVVEDEKALRETAADRLERSGMVVLQIDNPLEIGAALERFRPHVLVLNDHFESGVEFVSLMPDLIGQHPGVRVVVTTANPHSEMRPSQDPLFWGAADVLEKSTMFHGSRLEDTIRSVAAA